VPPYFRARNREAKKRGLESEDKANEIKMKAPSAKGKTRMRTFSSFCHTTLEPKLLGRGKSNVLSNVYNVCKCN
jgi:hypothetical protein